MSENVPPPATQPIVKTINFIVITACTSISATLLLAALVFPDQLFVLPAIAFGVVAIIEALRYGIVPDLTTRGGILHDGLGDGISTMILGYGFWRLAKLTIATVAEIPDFLAFILGVLLSAVAALTFVVGFLGAVHTVYKACKLKPPPPETTPA